MSLSVAVLTLPFDARIEAFDATALEALERRAEILDTTAAFFEHGCRAYWTLVIRHRLRPSPAESPRSAAPAEGGWRPLVPPADEGVYQALRAWRAKVADAEGIPPFMILTNRQLAAIATGRPASLAALGAVPGVGRGRLAKYGRAILSQLHGGDSSAAASEAAGAGPPLPSSTEEADEEGLPDRGSP